MNIDQVPDALNEVYRKLQEIEAAISVAKIAEPLAVKPFNENDLTYASVNTFQAREKVYRAKDWVERYVASKG